MVSVAKGLIGVGLVAVLALSGCATPEAGDGTPPAEEGTFSVWATLSLTGPLSGTSTAQREGLEVSIDALNEAGGINGQQIELTVVDDQLDPTKAVTLLQEQLDVEKPDLVIHGVSSGVTLAILPLLTQNEVLSIGTPYSDKINDPSSYPYAFGTNPEVRIDAEGAAELFESEGYEKIAFIASNDALGQAITEAYAAAIPEAGLEFIPETYAPADLDMTAQLQRLQAADPDVLVISGYGAAVGYVLKSRTKLGWTIDSYGDGGLGNGNNLALFSTEEDWNNLLLRVFAVNTPERASADSAAFATLVEGLEAKDSKLDQLMQLYAYMWDGLHVVKQAVEQAGAKDAPSVAAALEDLGPVEGESPFIVFPETRYSPENHFANQGTDAYVVVKPGPVVDGTIESIK